MNYINSTQRKTPMKNTRLQKHLLGAFATLALASSVSLAQPTNIFLPPSFTDSTTNTFSGNQGTLVFGSHEWQNWYMNTAAGAGITNSPNNAITNYTISFDTNNPPPMSPTGATLGSFRTDIGWDVSIAAGGEGATGGGGTSFAITSDDFWGGPTFNAGQYSAVEFDFKYDTNSTITPTNAAQFNVVLDTHVINGSANGDQLTNLANSGSNAALFDGFWHHISVPIGPTAQTDGAQSRGFGYNLFNGSGVSGQFTWWMANLELDAINIPVPPPIVSFVPTVNGLNLINDKAPNYTRHQVRTDPNGVFNVDWVGHTPVTYTWNYGHAPTNNGAGVNFAITPDPATNATYADPDWSATNCFYLAINEVGGTSVVANVTMKTNQAIGNSTAVSIVTLTNNTPTAAGTWSLTFNSDTSFVLTGPGGVTTNATIPANFLTTPYTGVSIFLSATPNSDANYGSYADVTTFDVTGVGTPIHENFVTQGGIVSPFLLLQDQTYGFVPTNVAPNMVFVTSNDWAWFQSSIPDAGFTQVVRTNLGPSGVWLDSPLTGTFSNGTNHWTLIPKSYVNSTSQNYFGMIKRTFSQLQVILPGETNAPNTPTGKTGSPTPVSLSDPSTFGAITYTVNACDASWHIIPGVFDTFTNSCTDTGAQVASPNPALSNGTNSIVQLGFSQTGNFTITVSDVSNTNILSNTSSSITVTP